MDQPVAESAYELHRELWGAHVFDEIHRPPSQLGTEVFDSQFVTIFYARFLQRILIYECFLLSFERELLSRRVELRMA